MFTITCRTSRDAVVKDAQKMINTISVSIVKTKHRKPAKVDLVSGRIG